MKIFSLTSVQGETMMKDVNFGEKCMLSVPVIMISYLMAKVLHNF